MTCSLQTKIDNLPLGYGVRLLASNQQGLIALDKPVGTLSHPNRKEDHGRCLLAADYDEKGEVYIWKYGDFIQRAWLLNRLDSPTSGVLILAVNEAIVPVVRKLFAAHRVRKTYYALVKNASSLTDGCWKDLLQQHAYQNARVSGPETKQFAKTYCHMVQRFNGILPLALVKLMPVTGRTHQLRIQCKYHRHPIAGDRTHGDFAFNRKVASLTGEKRLMLHSAEIDLNYIVQGKSYTFQAASPLPEAFARLACVGSEHPEKR